MTAAKLAGGLAVPAFESPLKGFGRGKSQQVGDFPERQFGVSDVSHGEVAARVVENCTKLRAFLGEFATQGPGRQLQACRHFFQVGFPTTIEQRPQ